MENLPQQEVVVIYVRVSSQRQMESGNWLDSQETICRERVKNQKWMEVVRVFSDGGVSGKFTSRDGLDAMIDFLAKENVNYTKITKVIVDDIDRIVRDVMGRRDIKAKIEVAGAKIYSLKQDLNDTPEGKMLQSITMSVKQYERENNARRTKDRQRARLLDWYWCFSLLPGYQYGYADKDRRRGGKVVEFNEPNATILREAFELFANGGLHDFTAFYKYLNNRGFKAKKSVFINKTSGIARVFEKSKLLFYCGIIHYPNLDISMVQGKHPPLISVATMEKIEERSRTLKRKRYQENPKEYVAQELPLRRSLCCEACGKPVTGSPSKNKLGNFYYYYSCKQKGCALYSKSFNNHKVHSAFFEHLDRLSIKDFCVKRFEDIFLNESLRKEAIISDQERQKENELNRLSSEIEVWKERVLNASNPILIKTYEDKLVSLLEQYETRNLETKQDSCERNDLKKLFTNTLKVLSSPRDLWNTEDTQLRQYLLSILFSNHIFYNQKSGIQTPKIPLIYSLLSDNAPWNHKWRREWDSNPRTE